MNYYKSTQLATSSRKGSYEINKLIESNMHRLKCILFNTHPLQPGIIQYNIQQSRIQYHIDALAQLYDLFCAGHFSDTTTRKAPRSR